MKPRFSHACKTFAQMTALFFAGAAFIAISALVIQAYVGSSTTYFVQSAYAETDSRVATATLRRGPTLGNTLIAVVASTGSESIPDQAGWRRIVASSNTEPAQAIFVRPVQPGDSKEITWPSLSLTGRHVLHVYEYRYLDLAQGIASADSASGEGKVAVVSPSHEPVDGLLEFTAIAVRGRESVAMKSPDGWTTRRNIMTYGSNNLTFSGADRISTAADVEAHHADIPDTGTWTMQSIALRTDQSIDAAAVAESDVVPVTVTADVDVAEPKEGDLVTLTVTVSNMGAEPVTNMEMLVRIPSYVKIRTATVGQGSYYPRASLWMMGDLAAGQTATLAVQTQVMSGSADATFFIRSALEAFDGMLEGRPLPWDAARVEVKAQPKLTEAQAVCPDITGASVKIAGDAESITSPTTTATLTATNATYILVAEAPEILEAEFQPYTTTLNHKFDSAFGPKTLYIWFASPCDQAQVESDSVELISANE